jgi:hypothetical protein
MESIRALARCINLGNPDNVSVVRDFFGYQTGAPEDLSLLQQVRRLKQRHIHLNLIHVGIASFTDNDEEEIDAAVQATREFYGQVGLEIGRVESYFTTMEEAKGRNNIDNDAEGENLTDKWTVPKDTLDISFVFTYSTPGYARKAIDSTRYLGSILGKALAPFSEKRGLALVLVALQ